MQRGSCASFWFIFMVMIIKTLMNSVGGLTERVFFKKTYASMLCVLDMASVCYISFSPCSNTLCAPEVISLINTRMLFWACSTNKPEGYRGKCFVARLPLDDWTLFKIHIYSRVKVVMFRGAYVKVESDCTTGVQPSTYKQKTLNWIETCLRSGCPHILSPSFSYMIKRDRATSVEFR